MPSPPINRAKNLVTDASKLPFNMSVTPLQAYQNSGSGKPRYGPPDAPLDSCPLVFARVRPNYEDRDPLAFNSFRVGPLHTGTVHSSKALDSKTHAETPARAGGQCILVDP